MKKIITFLFIISTLFIFLFYSSSCQKQGKNPSTTDTEAVVIPVVEVDIPDIEMISLPATQFSMGSRGGDADETPIHTVEFTNGILMGTYEVTNSQVAAVYTWGLVNGKIQADAETVVDTTGTETELIDINYPGCRLRVEDGVFTVEEGYGEHPCTLITWYGAVVFCNLLSENKGMLPAYDLEDFSCNWEANGYRLPTEAEWEFAARGGTKSKGYLYSGSNNPDDVAWYSDNANETTQPIGLKAPNEAGFYDMSGNVWECCWDYYGYYIPEIIDSKTFENEVLARVKQPDQEEYIRRIYIKNQETEKYNLTPELTNEECRKTWEVFRGIGYKMNMRQDPRGVRYRNKRVLRGGDWGSKAFYLRTTYRGRVFAQVSSTGYGFRIVRKAD